MEELNRAYEALQKAHEAGDEEGAKQIAAYARSLEMQAAAETSKVDNYAATQDKTNVFGPEIGAVTGATLGAAIGPKVGAGVDLAANQIAARVNPAAAKPNALTQALTGAPESNSPQAVKNWLRTQTSNPYAGGKDMSGAYKKALLAAGEPVQSRGSNIPIRKGNLGIGNQIPPETIPQKAASLVMHGERAPTPGMARRVAGMGVAGAELGGMLDQASQGNIGRATLSGLGALGGAATQSRIKPVRAVGTALAVGVPLAQKFLLPDEEEPQKKAAGGSIAKKLAPLAEEGLQKLKDVKLSDFEGKTLLGTLADRTMVGGNLKGGPMFPVIHEGAAWAMNAPGAASRLINAMQAAGGPDKTIVAPMLMKNTAHKSNRDVAQMAADQYRQNFQSGLFTPERMNEIDTNIRKVPGLENFPGMLHPDADELMHNMTFSQRGKLVNWLGSKAKTDQALDLDALLRKTAEPGLYDEPLGAVGPSVFNLTGEQSHMPGLHNSYDYVVHGDPLGAIKPVPREFLFRDLESKAMKELGRPLSDYNYRTSVGVPSQFIDDKLLKSLDELGHLKKGGKVKKKGKKK